MGKLIFYTSEQLKGIVRKRTGEIKFGEEVGFIKSFDELEGSPEKYVLLGMPEDIGVRANMGKSGTAAAWQACLAALLNIQANDHTRPPDFVLLGEIDCTAEMAEASTLVPGSEKYPEQLGELVSWIDEKVTATVQAVVKAGKVPIIIGGGHNNSYGNIKGASLALQQPVNALNFDAHTDFRPLEHRHSGNGFSYAFEEGYLQKYFIFGLHRNYTSRTVFQRLSDIRERVRFECYEDIEITGRTDFEVAMVKAEKFVTSGPFGLEIDLDAVAGVPASAQTPSGFSVEAARRFVHHIGRNPNVRWLHLCESAPAGGDTQTGKLLAYLITDFIRST